jgi:NitT/TauT family transport system substrate-binding protein
MRKGSAGTPPWAAGPRGRWLAALAWLIGLAACASGQPERAATGRPANTPPPVTAAASPAVPAAAVPAPAPINIRIPYTAVAAVHSPLWIAKEGGYLESEGIRAELEYIATSTILTQAMLAGEVALSSSALEALVSAGLAGADLLGLAVSSQRFPFRLYGDPSLGTVADLHGKRIAITRRGSTTDVAARLLVRQAGLEPDQDVAIVQTGGTPETVAAMQSGAADAGIVGPPVMFRLAAAGYRMLVDMSELDAAFHLAVLTSTRRYLAEQEDVVRRVVRSYVQAIARYRQDKVFAKQVLRQYTSTDDDEVLEQTYALQDRVMPRVPYPRAEAVQLALDQVAEERPEARTKSLPDFFDVRLLRELEENGFVDALYR